MPPIPGPEETGRRVLPAILLGEELARGLSVGTGDEVTVVVPDGDVGPAGLRPRTRTFRVAGTFVSGLYEHDLRTAYLNVREAEVLFLLGGPNRGAVGTPDLRDLDRTATIAREVLERHGGGEVRTVQETNRSLFSALRIEKVAMFLVLGLVILVAGFNIFGSLVLVAMEKSRDMAVLRSLGATHQAIRDLFLALGSSIGAVGTVAGLALGLATCAYIQWAGIRLPAEYYLRTLPVEVRAVEVGLVGLAALGSALLATLYPALSVARPSPSEGLRND
jgi:lipoprotein-releasing system permease protein